MAERPLHLRIFTSRQETSSPSLGAFHVFPDLPAELRLKVWECALGWMQPRLLKLHLRNRFLIDALLARQGDAIPSERQHEQYGVMIPHHIRSPSQLFFINRESRDVALSCYRVQLPVWFTPHATPDDRLRSGILCLSPEKDVIRLSNDTGQVAEFLHDLKTIYDPRNVGLCNLAVDQNDLNAGGGFLTIDPATLASPQAQTYKETLTQLRQLWFMHEQRTGRHVLGFLSGAASNEYRLNRAFPINSAVSEFRVLGRDPRPIGADLQHVFINRDPRTMAHAWNLYKHTHFGYQGGSTTQFQVLLTFDPVNAVHDWETAEELLQAEEDMWSVEAAAHSGDFGSAVSNAFGFWLLPVEAFGPLPESPDNQFETFMPNYLDLRDHWPELALFDCF
ncbi:hypothetical protein F5Y16DRAFT_381930 [Xylariaceae sp. FL0255]|nr:hypothetical protein F5Y16DRAFT_381930 [Xylariaceae sp. FL0255]